MMLSTPAPGGLSILTGAALAVRLGGFATRGPPPGAPVNPGSS